MGTTAQSKRYRFGLFEAVPVSGELLRQGVRVRVQDQPFRLLTILLERPGEVVSREEVRERLWPADTFVEFDGSLKAALKRLREALGDSAENPIFIETIPKRGYRFLAPVAVENEQPTAEAKEPIPEIQVPAPTSAPAAAAAPLGPTLWRRHPLYAACLIAALLAGLGWYSLRLRSRPGVLRSSSTAPLPVRRSVAILGFRNASARSEDDWLATALAEMLSTELTAGERLRLVPGEEVANLRLSSPWPQTITLGRETTARVGAALNSDVLVLGSYTAIGKADSSQLRFDVRLQDARTGEVLSQVAQTGNRTDLFRVASEIGARLRQQLGVPEIKDTEQAGVLASLPLDRDGARLYALGVAKLREFDALAAKDLLDQATKADPKFSLAHLMLSRSWGQLGYEQKRKEEAKKALDLSIDLPRTERLQLEGDYYESIPDHAKAASTYRALFELFPDNVEYGLLLGGAQNAADLGSQALETFAQLRRLPAATEDPRIDLAESNAQPNKAAALVLVRNAGHKAEAQGKKLLYARARLEECGILMGGNDPAQAPAACDDAYKIFLAAGNRLEAADSVRLIGQFQESQAHSEQAIATYQRALIILQGLGEHRKTGMVLNDMAIVFTNQGKLDRGEQLYREAKSHFEQAGDKRHTAGAIADIADLSYLRGDLSAAAKLYQQGLEIQTSLDHGDRGYALSRLSDVSLQQGKVQDAHRFAQQAIDAIRPTQGDYEHLTSAMTNLGEALEAEGDLLGARQQFQGALDIQQKMGVAEMVGESQEELAHVAMDEDHADQAEALLRTAIAEFEKEKSDPDATSAYIELSRALLMQGKNEEARTAIQHARELSRTFPNLPLQLSIAVQNARVDLARAKQGGADSTQEAARLRLRSTIETARKLGQYSLECDARLALGELTMKANPKLGRSLLTKLAAEAHQHGMELVAGKAVALIADPNVTSTIVAPSFVL